MPDLEKLNAHKQNIIDIIRINGPSYPGKISKETGISPLFASAFLAELTSERKLKISDMKIGSSPIYYIIGQEKNLENFIEHLNQKEREAFYLLKASQVLEDEKQVPAIRVALRKIKDFSMPLNVNINGEKKLFWKFFSLSEEETKEKITNSFEKKERKVEEKKDEKVKEKPIKKTLIKKQNKDEFSNLIKDYLFGKEIEILEEISSKKKELIAKVRIDTLFGKQEFLMIAKDKKKVSTNDLTIALQNSQTSKMPSLVFSTGELDKKANEYLRDWKNLIKFEQINL